MTASLDKTSGVVGLGAYFRIYALHPSGSSLIVQSGSSSGTQDWIRIEKIFYVSVNDVTVFVLIWEWMGLVRFCTTV